MDGKEPLWFRFFFCLQDVGKGREQDAEAFAKRNELAASETAIEMFF
jgi:hypothetical protein